MPFGKKLDKKIEELNKKYPNEPLCINIEEGTAELDSQYRLRIKRRNEDLILGIIIGIFVGLAQSFIYDVIIEIFNLAFYSKVFFTVISLTISYILIKAVLRDDFGVHLK